MGLESTKMSSRGKTFVDFTELNELLPINVKSGVLGK